MEGIGQLLEHGFEIAVQPSVLLAALVGALIGTLVGVLPGIGPVGGAAIVLPLSYQYDPIVGLVIIAGIFLGSQYGGSTTAVLLAIPGEASSIPATLDGNLMAKRGRAGVALSIMAVGSWVAGTASLLVIAAAAPFLSEFALNFGPPEFFALTAGGLILLSRISGGSLASGLFPMSVGIMLATVGLDPSSSVERFTFGRDDLVLGFSIVTVAVGVFGLTELVLMLEQGTTAQRATRVRFRELLPTRADWRRCPAPWARGTTVGFLFGLLPVPSATLGAFSAYSLEKSVGKHRAEVGTGAVEGVAAPEAANNGAAASSLVPLLVLGLPFSATLALALAAMQVHGIQPGPLLITRSPDVFWGVLASMLIANVMLIILNLPLVGLWVRILQVPKYLLLPVVVVFAVIGAYSDRNNMFDVRVVLLMGLVGYVFKKLDFSLASLLVGLVLGPLIEKFLRQGLFISKGDLSYFVSTPVSAIMWTLVLLALLSALLPRRLRRRSIVLQMDTADDEL